MTKEPISIILAEDDEDDRLLFEDALRELSILTQLKIVHDGEQLMQLLIQNEDNLAHVLFLDINMPRKNGIDCLNEIKSNQKLTRLPVIIFSTYFDKEMINKLHDQGANYYMRKPTGFLRLREIIEQSLNLILTSGRVQPPKDKFVLNVV